MMISPFLQQLFVLLGQLLELEKHWSDKVHIVTVRYFLWLRTLWEYIFNLTDWTMTQSITQSFNQYYSSIILIFVDIAHFQSNTTLTCLFTRSPPVINSTWWRLQFALIRFKGVINLWLPQMNSNPLNPIPPLTGVCQISCLLSDVRLVKCIYLLGL